MGPLAWLAGRGGAAAAPARVTRSELHPVTARQLAPGTFTRPDGLMQCGACGLVTFGAGGQLRHRTLAGKCLDPALPGPRGGLVLSPHHTAGDGAVVWAMPRENRRALGMTVAERLTASLS
jgi:hypothetical protein